MRHPKHDIYLWKIWHIVIWSLTINTTTQHFVQYFILSGFLFYPQKIFFVYFFLFFNSLFMLMELPHTAHFTRVVSEFEYFFSPFFFFLLCFFWTICLALGTFEINSKNNKHVGEFIHAKIIFLFIQNFYFLLLEDSCENILFLKRVQKGSRKALCVIEKHLSFIIFPFLLSMS